MLSLDINCGTFLGYLTQAVITSDKLKEADVDKAITNNFVTMMRLRFVDGKSLVMIGLNTNTTKTIGNYGGIILMCSLML